MRAVLRFDGTCGEGTGTIRVGEMTAGDVCQLGKREVCTCYFGAHRTLGEILHGHRALGARPGLNTVEGQDVGVDRNAERARAITKGGGHGVAAVAEYVDADRVARRVVASAVERGDVGNRGVEWQVDVTRCGIDGNRFNRCNRTVALGFAVEDGGRDNVGARKSGHRNDRFWAYRQSTQRDNDGVFDAHHLLRAELTGDHVVVNGRRIRHKHHLERGVPTGHRAGKRGRIGRHEACEHRRAGAAIVLGSSGISA